MTDPLSMHSGKIRYRRDALLPPEPPEEVKDAYWRDLGQFVHQFARVEKLIIFTLLRYAEVSRAVGQALFSGVRIQEACSFINRILEARNMKEGVEAKDIAAIGAQIGHITNMRNAILHFGTRFTDSDSFEVANRHLAYNERTLRSYPASSKILKQMIADLAKIIDHLTLHIIGWDQINRLREEDRESLRAPWQYKPPQQVGDQHKRRDKPPKQKRQP